MGLLDNLQYIVSGKWHTNQGEMFATVFLYLSRKQTATVCHFPKLLYFQEDILAQRPSTKLKLEYLSCRNP